MKSDPYLPALVMIISVPMSWKRFHRSAHCSSTWISSMEAGGEASQGPGASSAGEPKEHDVLSARPSPSEPGLASESGGKMRNMMREPRSNSGINARLGFYAGNLASWESSAVFPADSTSPAVCSLEGSGRAWPDGSSRHGALGFCQKQD